MLLLLLLSLCVSPATVLKITPCHARSHKGLPEKELWDCWCNIFVGCIPFLSPTSVKVLKRQNNLNYVIWNYLFRLPGNLTVKPTVTKQLNHLNTNSLESHYYKAVNKHCTNHIYLVLIHSTSSKCPSSSHLGQYSPRVFPGVVTATVTLHSYIIHNRLIVTFFLSTNIHLTANSRTIWVSWYQNVRLFCILLHQ